MVILQAKNSEQLRLQILDLCRRNLDFFLVNPLYTDSEAELLMAAARQGPEENPLSEEIALVRPAYSANLPEGGIPNFILAQTDAHLYLASSGTMGVPKIIRLPIKLLYQRAADFCNRFELRGYQSLHYLSYASVGGFNQLLRDWSAGNSIVDAGQSLLEPAADVYSAMLPSHLLGVIRSGQLTPLRNIRKLFIGGAGVRDLQAAEIRAAIPQAELIYTYALTEAGGTVASKSGGQSSFTVFENFSLLETDHGFSLKIEDLSQTLELSDRFTNLSELCAPQTFSGIVRSQRQVNCGGQKFSLDDLENSLSTKHGRDFFCVKVDSGKWQESAICYFVGSDSEMIDALEINAYQRPETRSLPEIPKTSAGKTDYRALQLLADGAKC